MCVCVCAACAEASARGVSDGRVFPGPIRLPSLERERRFCLQQLRLATRRRVTEETSECNRNSQNVVFFVFRGRKVRRGRACFAAAGGETRKMDLQLSSSGATVLFTQKEKRV